MDRIGGRSRLQQVAGASARGSQAGLASPDAGPAGAGAGAAAADAARPAAPGRLAEPGRERQRALRNAVAAAGLMSLADQRAAVSARPLAKQMEKLVKASLHVGHLDTDVSDRLQTNAGVLADKGINTPEKLRSFLKSAWRHDAALAVGLLGFTGNAGYAVGMELASEKLVAMLPAQILKNPSFLGLLVGLGVGALDVAISVVGKAAFGPLVYNGADGMSKLPGSIPVPSSAERALSAVAEATAANFLKNAPRLVAPAVQAGVEALLEGRPKPSIHALTADRIDIALDGGLGFVSSAALQFNNLAGKTPGYDARLLLREDLGAVIDKTRSGVAASAIQVAGSVGAALAQPTVPLAVVATIGVFISQLFAANASIATGGPSPDQLPPGDADLVTTTYKRMSSVATMALMTAAIEFGAPIVGAAAAAGGKTLANATGHAAAGLARVASATAVRSSAYMSAAAGSLPNIGLPNIGAWMHAILGNGAPAEDPGRSLPV